MGATVVMGFGALVETPGPGVGLTLEPGLGDGYPGIPGTGAFVIWPAN